jgi:hypothetical protein
MEDALRRAEPIADAIRQFEEENGSLPIDLSSLVPKYLSCVPSTDIRACPEFEYRRHSAGTYLDRPRRVIRWDVQLPCNVWVLRPRRLGIARACSFEDARACEMLVRSGS